jgi:gas vesicle protein
MKRLLLVTGFLAGSWFAGCRAAEKEAPPAVNPLASGTAVIRGTVSFDGDIHAFATKNKEFNIGQPVKGLSTERTFEVAEVMIPVRCDVHKWMGAYVGVVDHPFFAVTESDGRFELGGLPAGEYVVEAWHEQYGVRQAKCHSRRRRDPVDGLLLRSGMISRRALWAESGIEWHRDCFLFRRWVMENGGNTRSFAFGFFAGAFLGSLGALLMAPMSGRRLRRELSREGRRVSHRLAETAEELRDRGLDAYESAAEVATDTARAVSRAAHSVAR